jgi:outer membrane receptor protein involved in Fe transport
MHYKKTRISFLCVLLSIGLSAQQLSTARGVVVGRNNQPLSNASVVLYPISNPTVVTAATATDTLGRFTITSNLIGDYGLYISYIGYDTLEVKAPPDRQTNGTGPTDTFRLHPAQKMLPEIQIIGRKNFMTIEGDKKVFTVEQMGGIAGGNAGNVLQQVPLVEMDNDGNVTLRGKGANVLIDGKPFPFSDVATTLQMIPSDGIAKVEVMTNPSAKYDAEGQGGIVNIVLKKDQLVGTHGLINLDIGTRPDYHIGTDFNSRRKKWNVFGNVNFHTRAVAATGINEQHFFPMDSSWYTRQTSHSYLRSRDIDSRLGLDYTLDYQTSITLSGGLSFRKALTHAAIAIDSGGDEKSMYSYGSGNNETQNLTRNISGGIDLIHHFTKTGEQLTTNVLISVNSRSGYADLQDTGIITSPVWQENNINSRSDIFVLQADYVDPTGKQDRIEVGYKSNFSDNRNSVNASVFDSTASQFTYDEGLSSLFSYKDQVHAAYATYAGHLRSIRYKAGIRTEMAILDGTSYLQQISFHKQFFNLFPSLFLSRDLGAGQSIRLSFATRISRPTFEQLLPYTDVSNPVSHVSGNPSLAPAYTKTVELNYTNSFGKSGNFLNVDLYFSCTHNTIQMVTTNDTAEYTLTQPQNIANNQTVGSDLIYRFSWWKRVRFTTTLEVRYTAFSRIAASPNALSGNWNGSLRLNGEIDLPLRFLLFAHGELTTPQPLPQGYTNKNKGIDLEIRKPFFRSRLTCALIVSDVLNDRRETTHVTSASFVADSEYKEDSRMLHLHLNYNF